MHERELSSFLNILLTVNNLCMTFWTSHPKAHTAWLKELNADGLVDFYVLMGVVEETAGGIDKENLDDAAVAAGTKKETAVGRDVEITWMCACWLVTYFV